MMSDHTTQRGIQMPRARSAERVVLGLLLALVGVVGGVALTVVVWRAGYLASVTLLVMGFAAALLYELGARTTPNRGAIPLLTLVLVGMVASFFAVVASDLWDLYDTRPRKASRTDFIKERILDPEVLGELQPEILLFVVFGLIGIGAVVRRMVAGR